MATCATSDNTPMPTAMPHWVAVIGCHTVALQLPMMGVAIMWNQVTTPTALSVSRHLMVAR